MRTRLMLTRKLNEEIVIHSGGKVLCIIKPSEVRGLGLHAKVKFCCEAEPEIKLDRSEIYKAKQKSGPMLDGPNLRENLPDE